MLYFLIHFSVTYITIYFENGRLKENEEERKKKMKPSINNARYLICQNELKGKNVDNIISNFLHCSCQSG